MEICNLYPLLLISIEQDIEWPKTLLDVAEKKRKFYLSWELYVNFMIV
jgi:hypothetical protein